MKSLLIRQWNAIRKEIFALALGFGVLFVLLSLLSHHSSDINCMKYGGTRGVGNLFGPAGAEAAHFCFTGFGVGAYWIPLLMIHGLIRHVRRYPKHIILINMTGGAVLAGATGAVFSLFTRHVSIGGGRIDPAGVLGNLLRDSATHYLGNFGGGLLLFLLLITAFMFTTGLSLNDLTGRFAHAGRAAGRSGRRIGDRLLSFTGKLPERRALPAPPGKKRASAPSFPEPEEMDPDTRIPDFEEARPTAGMSGSQPPESAPFEPAAARAPVPEPQRFSLPGMAAAGKGLKKGLSAMAGAARAASPVSSGPSPGSVPTASPRMARNSDSAPDQPKLPPLTFLENRDGQDNGVTPEYLDRQAERLEQKLADFGVRGEVTGKRAGPVITTYEYRPAPGVKINKIVNLADDLALGLKAMSIRIVAPIPGKDAIGIEIPNKQRSTVRLKEVVDSDFFRRSASRLTLCLGKDIEGVPVVTELDAMPHLLIAGATGTGKSVGLNAMICSLLYKASWEEVKMIMVDPKRIELSLYNDIPHLITPVVTDVKKATNALFWAVGEMERRYTLLSDLQVRNIRQYNRKAASGEELYQENGQRHEHLPYIVIIIDELADLMVVAGRDVELALMRLAQMARAAGLHLILATQRPSVDVLTGVIKANFPTRLSFQVSSRTDSRTIIDGNGAEKLLGRGDMLFLPPGTARLRRIQGAYISEEELVRITEFLKSRKRPEYDENVLGSDNGGAADKEESGGYDEHYDTAVALVVQKRQASISMIQRHLRIGYNRAARIMEVMEREGVVGPADGARPREVLLRDFEDHREGEES